MSKQIDTQWICNTCYGGVYIDRSNPKRAIGIATTLDEHLKMGAPTVSPAKLTRLKCIRCGVNDAVRKVIVREA